LPRPASAHEPNWSSSISVDARRGRRGYWRGAGARDRERHLLRSTT
jgi:hypothetical protein